MQRMGTQSRDARSGHGRDGATIAWLYELFDAKIWSSRAKTMMWSRATHAVLAFLIQRAQTPRFPLLVGFSAFLSTVTFTLPVELLVVISVLLNRYRWIGIAVFSAIGSSLASLGLYLAFHHLGWSLLIEWYPDIAASRAWADATRWLSRYGSVALFLLMALPLAAVKTPALAFAGIYRMPAYEVLLAVGLGKLLKYAVYAYIASRFPDRFDHLYAALVPRQGRMIAKPGEAQQPVSIEGVRKLQVRRWWFRRMQQ